MQRLFDSVVASLGLADQLQDAARRDVAVLRRPRLGPDAEPDEAFLLLFTPDAVEVRLPTIDWTGGSYDPVRSSRYWKRVPLAGLLSAEEWGTIDHAKLEALLVAAEVARAKECRRCQHCRRRVGPERLAGRSCHSCAERHDHVVF